MVNFNNEQLKAVFSEKQHIRIIAGAGSGKTSVLTYRIAHLINERKINPQQILVLTFTNKAANEIKKRLQGILNDNILPLYISTFHSFCVSFLRQEITFLNLKQNFKIIDDEDTKKIINNICKKYEKDCYKYISEQAIRYIKNKKNKCLYPDNINDNDIDDKLCFDIFKEYEKEKNENSMLDFWDLICKTIIILKKSPEIRNKWIEKIHHILIDEFQDTNDIQIQLIDLLSDDKKTSICVVGDPDQTIYTWRNADQKFILDFPNKYPNSETIILEQNYRSTKTILNAANALISKNINRVTKTMFTNNEEDHEIKLFKCFKSEEEAQYVADNILQLKEEKKIKSLKEIAVICRTAKITLPLEKKLSKNKINYRIFGGFRFYQRKEVKDVLAYFYLITNSQDNFAFERIINIPKRKIGQSTIRTIKIESQKNNLSCYEYVKNIEEYNSNINSKTIKILKNFIDEIETVKKELSTNKQEKYGEILESFLEKIGYFEYLESSDKNENENISEIVEKNENLEILLDDLNSFLNNNKESFTNWLQNCSLATSQDELDDINDDYISIMTAHASKGLEFNYVFVIGLAEKIFPDWRRAMIDNSNELEEERRLCYVAFTRAKKQLFISMSTNYFPIFSENKLKMSRFIQEANLEIPFISFERKHKSITFKKEDREQITFKNFFVKEEKEDKKIIKWQVNDKVMHKKFGEGIVKKVVDETTIVVDFKNFGEKNMLSNHHMIEKIEE